ncbi:MAG TPA: cyclic nucleotide-binding domain-containing protein [Gaiellaceae bacterium]|jgi:CRP-like cAMP-binding protein|nr:cyclic nucleotide-binding domain-containing protein [Gaiellaceae bacterium]
MDASRIAALDAFADLPPGELDELAAVLTHVEIEAGTELITHRKDGYLVYFVEQGEAEVLTDDGEVVRALGPGDTFGEIAILTTGPRTATVVARTQMLLLALFDADFQRIRARVPEFERSLRSLGSERLGA